MTTHYFAIDGNYGDATDLILVHTDDWTEEDWDRIFDTNDNDRLAVAKEICDSKQSNIRLLGL